MAEWSRVEAILGVLDRIRPILRADGIEVELLEVQENNARIRLTGICPRCASGRLSMQTGLEEALRAAIRDFGELQLLFD
jgi:Fe-S cluster biogenesis protein NfuA